MTWTAEDDATGREEVRTPRALQAHRVRRTLLCALVGAVLLGGLGIAWGSSRTAPVSAVALVSSTPDPTAVEAAAGGTTDGDPTARNATYLETELVTLGGAELADRVAAATEDTTPELEATRSGESNVIQIQATADDTASAVRDAQTAADLYVQDRQRRLTDRITAQTQAVQEQIDATNAALLALDRPLATGFDPQAQQREVLSGQYADQLASRDALQRAGVDVTQVAAVVEQAKPLPGGALSPTVLAAIAAAAIGALLGAFAPRLLGSLRGRLRDEQDLADLGVPVLAPRLRWQKGSRPAADTARAVQLQALALPAGPVSGGSVAFVASTAGVGASFAAVQHARHAARRGRVLLVLASGGDSQALAGLGLDPQHVGLADLAPAPGTELTAESLAAAVQPTATTDLFVLSPGSRLDADFVGMERALAAGVVPAAVAAGWAVVVDTAPLDRSDAGLQAARQCAETVLVTAIGVSRLDDVEQTVQLLRSAGVRVSGIMVTRPPRRSARATSSHRSSRSRVGSTVDASSSKTPVRGRSAAGGAHALTGPGAAAPPAAVTDQPSGDGSREHAGHA